MQKIKTSALILPKTLTLPLLVRKESPSFPETKDAPVVFLEWYRVNGRNNIWKARNGGFRERGGERKTEERGLRWEVEKTWLEFDPRCSPWDAILFIVLIISEYIVRGRHGVPRRRIREIYTIESTATPVIPCAPASSPPPLARSSRVLTRVICWPAC